MFSVLPLLADAPAAGQGSVVYTLVVWGALFAFMWFVLIRPQRKRQKETEALQSSIQVGDAVLLSSGMYGKVVDTVNKIVIVELGTNKSVRVPVLRSGIASKSEPDLSIVKESTEE